MDIYSTGLPGLCVLVCGTVTKSNGHNAGHAQWPIISHLPKAKAAKLLLYYSSQFFVFVAPPTIS